MLKLKARNFIFRHARQSAWRVGRWLYSLARDQTVNDMAVNGEARLQQMVVDAAQTDGRGITVCDVGANLGEWSDMMLQTAAVHGLDIRLFAFEPIPMTADRFAARFEGRPEAPLLWRMALSDSDGKGEMAVFSETGGTNSLVFRDDEDPPTITVPLQTFDTWSAAQSVEAIDLMKIDAEGHDMAVLRGCTGMLRSGKLKVIQFEYNHRWITARAFLRDAFNLAQSFGYRVGQVCPEGIEIYNQRRVRFCAMPSIWHNPSVIVWDRSVLKASRSIINGTSNSKTFSRPIMCWCIKTGLASLFTGAVISTPAMSMLPVHETHTPWDWIARKYSPG